MVKNRDKSAKKYKEYLAWLKVSRIKAAKIQKEYKSGIKKLADEAAKRHKDYLAKHTEWEKKLGKEL